MSIVRELIDTKLLKSMLPTGKLRRYRVNGFTVLGAEDLQYATFPLLDKKSSEEIMMRFYEIGELIRKSGYYSAEEKIEKIYIDGSCNRNDEWYYNARHINSDNICEIIAYLDTFIKDFGFLDVGIGQNFLPIEITGWDGEENDNEEVHEYVRYMASFFSDREKGILHSEPIFLMIEYIAYIYGNYLYKRPIIIETPNTYSINSKSEDCNDIVLGSIMQSLSKCINALHIDFLIGEMGRLVRCQSCGTWFIAEIEKETTKYCSVQCGTRERVARHRKKQKEK